MRDLTELTPAYLDALREVGNIGAAHAATALSQLINKPIRMSIPRVRVAGLQELNVTEKPVAASYIKVDRGIEGHFFMIFEVAQANQLVQALIPGGSVLDRSIGEDAYCEISNILCGSYISALSTFLDLSFTQTPPVFAADMEGAILGEGLIELSLYHNTVLLIEALLFDRTSNRRLTGEFLFLPVPNSMDALLGRIERKLSG